LLPVPSPLPPPQQRIAAQVAVSSKQGSSLPATTIAVGPTAAAPAAADVRLAFTGPHVAPCTYVNDTGSEVTEACTAGVVNVAAQYYEVR